MSDIEISEVTSRRERDAFIKFPWQIYANDPAWVPPLILERKAFLDRKRHPFYRHGDAALFLARKDGKILGRIMASDDPYALDLYLGIPADQTPARTYWQSNETTGELPPFVEEVARAGAAGLSVVW